MVDNELSFGNPRAIHRRHLPGCMSGRRLPVHDEGSRRGHYKAGGSSRLIGVEGKLSIGICAPLRQLMDGGSQLLNISLAKRRNINAHLSPSAATLGSTPAAYVHTAPAGILTRALE